MSAIYPSPPLNAGASRHRSPHRRALVTKLGNQFQLTPVRLLLDGAPLVGFPSITEVANAGDER